MGALGRGVVIVVLGLTLAFPVFYLISGSLMSFQEISQYPPRLVPSSMELENFVAAIDYLKVRTIANTFIFVLGVLFLQLALCLLAGFALARIRFRGSNVMLVLFVVPLFIPMNLILIPVYIVTFQLGLIGSFAGMILPIAAQVSFGVLLFRQFFAGLPDGLIDAAQLDGASWWQIFWRVALPLAKPVLASYAVLTFMSAWNLYVWPQLAGPGEATRVLTVALAPLATAQYSNISPSVGFAAAVVAMLPVLVVFVALQRWFTRGVVGSGLE
jgi:multiple sugar transport system permease protein